LGNIPANALVSPIRMLTVSTSNNGLHVVVITAGKHTCECTCFSTLDAGSFHNYHRVSCCSNQSWEGNIPANALVSPFRMLAVSTTTTGFPVAVITVWKHPAGAGPSKNSAKQHEDLYFP